MSLGGDAVSLIPPDSVQVCGYLGGKPPERVLPSV